MSTPKPNDAAGQILDRNFGCSNRKEGLSETKVFGPSLWNLLLQAHAFTVAGASCTHAGQEYAANMTRKKVKEDKMKARSGRLQDQRPLHSRCQCHDHSPRREERKQFHDEVEACELCELVGVFRFKPLLSAPKAQSFQCFFLGFSGPKTTESHQPQGLRKESQPDIPRPNLEVPQVRTPNSLEEQADNEKLEQTIQQTVRHPERSSSFKGAACQDFQGPERTAESSPTRRCLP